ncbi:Glycerophosphoinositol permease [Lachnellula willkommii]|uniref:Glycerophosphoinositol permease n=1 Tax=Lachnellula willkommii TaxID=215461 RepID=A0A559MCA6_9HELO|nr:Glycerophosphoinositol permease [Lachnellula willkommii]
MAASIEASTPNGKDGAVTKEVPAKIDEMTVPEHDAEDMFEGTVKTAYSKLSTTLMVVFSALAIGSDGFNSSIIGNLSLIFGVLYPDLSTGMYSRLSNAFIIGMIIGMLGFGYFSDRLGRKSGAIFTTLILVVGIAMSAGASGKDEMGMFWMLVVSRGIAGVGAGGEYPVSGAGATEATDENSGARNHRGFIFAMIADVSATFGFIFGGLVPLLLILCFHQNEAHYHIVWRLALALGAIPPLSIFWFRYKMAVSTAYKKSAAKKQRIPYRLIFKRYWRPLLGCSIGWFLLVLTISLSYNYISYPFGLFASTITERLGIGNSLVKNMGWGTVINCFYIPGGIIGGLLSDRIGRRRTMAIGFGIQAIVGFIIGGALGSIQTVLPLFIVLYGIFLTLGEVGPGATLILTSSESFPTSIRGQCLGLIAAFGKAGAAVGTSVFKPILASFGDSTYKGNQAVFLIGSAFALVGAFTSWYLIPDISNRLENEDEVWKAYLRENGYEIQWGEEDSDTKGLKMDGIVS